MSTAGRLLQAIHEARLQAKMPAMGFLNPFVYKNADAFFDVVKGINAIGRGTGPLGYGFNCTKGWDPATGVGTPNFGKLLAAAMGTANVVYILYFEVSNFAHRRNGGVVI